jgi:hypothetical protein
MLAYMSVAMSEIARQIEEARRAAASTAEPSGFRAICLVRWPIGCIGVLMLGALVVGSFLGYFVGGVGPDGAVLDGFGRQVYEAPFMLSIIEIDRWRGLGWFVFDIVAFWGTLGLGVLLVSFGFGRR